jgi:hypothetical protein
MMEESRAKEIANEFIPSLFGGISFIENEYGLTATDDNGNEVIDVYISGTTFVPQEQANVNSKFRAAWIVCFRTTDYDYIEGERVGTGHGRITMYIDAQTGEVWAKSGRGKNRKLTAQEKRAVRKERWEAERNSEKKGLIDD